MEALSDNKGQCCACLGNHSSGSKATRTLMLTIIRRLGIALIVATRHFPPRLERYLRKKDIYWTMMLIFICTIGISSWALYRAEQAANGQKRIDRNQAEQIAKLRRITRQNRKLAAQNHTALVAVCGLRSELVKRIASSEKDIEQQEAFLIKNPNGIPGIPATLIRSGIMSKKADVANQKRSLESLKIARCP